jgi:hypothetical protein
MARTRSSIASENALTMVSEPRLPASPNGSVRLQLRDLRGIVGDLDRGVLAQHAVGDGRRLVPVSELVHHAFLLGGGGTPRRVVDPAAHHAGVLLAVGGDAVHHLRQPGIGQLLQVLAQRRRHRGFGEQVGRAFELLALADLWLDAEPVERGAQERLLNHEAHGRDFARRLQEDAVRAGGDIVVQGAVAGLAEGLGEGVDRLGAVLEAGDRVADLLRLGDVERPASDLQHHALHATVIGRSLEAQDDVLDRRLADRRERQPDMVLGQALAEVDGEDGLVRNLDVGPAQLIEEKEAGNDQGDHRDAEQRQQPENEPHDKTEKTHCTNPSFLLPRNGAPS